MHRLLPYSTASVPEFSKHTCFTFRVRSKTGVKYKRSLLCGIQWWYEPRKAYGIRLSINSLAAKYTSNVGNALDVGAREKQNTHTHTHIHIPIHPSHKVLLPWYKHMYTNFKGSSLKPKTKQKPNQIPPDEKLKFFISLLWQKEILYIYMNTTQWGSFWNFCAVMSHQVSCFGSWSYLADSSTGRCGTLGFSEAIL